MSLWHQLGEKTYFYKVAGKVNFVREKLFVDGSNWSKNSKQIPVLDFSTVPDHAMIDASNKAILNALQKTTENLNRSDRLVRVSAKGLDNHWQSKNSTMLYGLLAPFLFTPDEFRAKVSKNALQYGSVYFCLSCVSISC